MFPKNLLAGIALLAGLGSAGVAHAGTFTTLTTFLGGTDGAYSYAGVDLRYGLLRGTTKQGGAYGYGVVFGINPSTGAETVEHSFAGNEDGAYSTAPLTLVKKLEYGTTSNGGAYDNGTIFEINPKSGKEKVLYSFATGTDGANPTSILVNVKGVLYGVTYHGGSPNAGTIFKFDLSTNTETVVYTFGGATDGTDPVTGLLYVGGVLYGTTQFGGANNVGVVFSYNPTTGVETTLHAFGAGTDGQFPLSGLIYDSGLIYGDAIDGGTLGYGMIYSINPQTGAETDLYDFTGGSDGGQPVASLADASGLFYGSAATGALGYGTLFSFNPKTAAFSLLYTFTNGADGANPQGQVFRRGSTIYGTTAGTGSGSSYGSVFKYVP